MTGVSPDPRFGPSPDPRLSGGLWGVLATPFEGRGGPVDEESLRAEVRLYRELPATGLVVLGVFGEGAALDGAEQRRVVEVVAQESGTLPLVVGVAALSTAPVVEQATHAVAAAADRVAAVMVQANTTDPAVLVDHLTAVHEAVGCGLVVQDYPVTSGVRTTPAQLLAVVRACPFVAAVKSESPPTAVAIADLVAHSDVPVFGGLGGVGLLDELAAGAAGAMTGFSHPEGLLAALRAWSAGGYDAARAAFAPWLPIAVFEAQPGIGLAIRKECLRLRGIFRDAAVRPPASPLPDALRGMVRRHVDSARTLLGGLR